MADQKISALTALTGVNVDSAADVLVIVDDSVTETKKILVSEIAGPIAFSGAATQAQQEAAASVSTFVTPLRQHFHPGHPKAIAMVTVSGGTPTLQTPPSYNITSITDTAQGRLTITIATDFSSANWCCLATIEANNIASVEDSTLGVSNTVLIDNTSIAAGSILLECWKDTIQDTASGFPGSQSVALADPVSWHMIGFGDQA